MQPSLPSLRAALYVLSAFAVCVCTLLATHDAHAQRRKATPEDTFKESIILSEREFPVHFKDDASFIRYVRKARTVEIVQNEKETPWKINYMAFFKRALSGAQYTVIFYDITDPKTPTVVTRSDSFPSQKNFRITSGTYTLEEPLFKPDRAYLMVYTKDERKAPLAEVEFVLRPYDAKRVAAQAKRMKSLDAEAKKASSRQETEKEKKLLWEPPDW